MSEHQSSAGIVPDRGPSVDAPGQGNSPEAAGQGPQGAAGGYGEAPAGSVWKQSQAQGSAHVYGQGGGSQGGPQSYGTFQNGQGEAMGPSSGSGHFMYGNAGAMPPGYGQAPYAQPAPGQGYYAPPQYAPGVPYGAYAGYPPPPPGVYPPNAYQPNAYQGLHPGYAHGAAQGDGQTHGARMTDLVEEVANGGNGLSTLSKMLNFDDPDFWKGALVGTAAVLLLTSDSVQSALFGSGSNGNGGKGSSA